MQRHTSYIIQLILIATSNTLLAFSGEREDLTNHLIISIANLSGQLCTLEKLDLRDGTITRGSPPTILANQTEKSFWMSDQTFGLFSRKNHIDMTFKCGEEQLTISSRHDACNLTPHGETTIRPSARIRVEYKALTGSCSNGSPGLIMWRINSIDPKSNSIKLDKQDDLSTPRSTNQPLEQPNTEA